jgi:hypothetical protein
LKTKLSESQIKFAFNQLKADSVAKLVGILSHFVYWSVFGGFNNLPIDSYHMEKMLRTILEQLKSVEESTIKSSVDNFVLQRSKREKEKGGQDPEPQGEHERDPRKDKERLDLPDMKLLQAKTNAKNLF